MNGFFKHGIGHSSPSQINKYAAAPCAWAAQYLFGYKFTFSLAARAGVLAEEAVQNVLLSGWTAEAATQAAVSEYAKASAFSCTDAEAKRGEGIPGMIEGALAALAPYGTPEAGTDLTPSGAKQKKIELICNGGDWSLPITGFLDFWYPAHGLVVDLKTTMRMPSSMSDEHTRQGAIYKAAMGNHAVKFLYCTPKKSDVFEIGDVSPVLAEIKTILIRQERLLRLDADEIKALVPVISSSFYWGGDEAIRKELYGI